MKLTLSKVALIAFAATTAFTATRASAAQYRTYGCDTPFFDSCGVLIETPTSAGKSRPSVVHHDTSPTYMKQSDPRYSSSMRDAGGGGGGGGV